MEGRDEEANLHLKRVYRKKDANDPRSIEELLKTHYGVMRKSTTLDAASTTFK